MGRRRGSVRCTEIKDEPLRIYEVGYMVNDVMQRDHLEAHSISIDGDDLVVYEHIKGLDEQIGGFKNWCYFRVVKPSTDLC